MQFQFSTWLKFGLSLAQLSSSLFIKFLEWGSKVSYSEIDGNLSLVKFLKNFLRFWLLSTCVLISEVLIKKYNANLIEIQYKVGVMGYGVCKSKLLYWEDTQKDFGSKNILWPGPEGLEVGPAENSGALKSGFFTLG